MKKLFVICFLMTTLFVCVEPFSANNENSSLTENTDHNELYYTILQQDSIFFNAYNTCDIATQAEYYSDSIEFFHDQGGLATSKKDILEATEKNICGKVTRELVEGSVEVYPINNYGAVEIGLHIFHNLVEKTSSHPSRYIIIWRQVEDKWEISKVVSLH